MMKEWSKGCDLVELSLDNVYVTDMEEKGGTLRRRLESIGIVWYPEVILAWQAVWSYRDLYELEHDLRGWNWNRTYTVSPLGHSPFTSFQDYRVFEFIWWVMENGDIDGNDQDLRSVHWKSS